MATRLELGLWRAAWAKPENFKLRLADFQAAIDAGASVWVAPSKAEPMKTLVGALCRAHHCDLGSMLSVWIRSAGDIGSPPPGHPPVLSCIPLDGSVSAVDKLVAAGADASTPSASVALFQKALLAPEAFGGEPFWALADRLLDLSSLTICQLAPHLGHAPSSLFELITRHQPPESGNRVMVSRGGWDLAWKDSPSVCRWVCMILASGDVLPETLSHSGFDWKGADKEGNTLAHHLVMQMHYSGSGNPILPMEALVEAHKQGLTLLEDNVQGWSVMQRIRALKWENDNDGEKLFALMDAARLHRSTVPASSKSTNFRL